MGTEFAHVKIFKWFLTHSKRHSINVNYFCLFEKKKEECAPPFCQVIFSSVKTLVNFHPILHGSKCFHCVSYYKILLQVSGEDYPLKTKPNWVG